MTANEYVLPVADARAAQLAVAGGKGGLEPSLLAALDPVDASQPATLEAAAVAIGELISGGRMARDVGEAVLQACVR